MQGWQIGLAGTSVMGYSKSFIRALLAILLVVLGAGLVQAGDRNLFYFSAQKQSVDLDFDSGSSSLWGSKKSNKKSILDKSRRRDLDLAITKYSAIVKSGGWKPIAKVKLAPAVNHAEVKKLRARLVAVGDMKPGKYQLSKYDYYVERGVKAFQKRHGLRVTGVVDRSTRAAMNVSARTRLRQLRLNKKRLRRYSKTPGRYIVVNIPAAQIEAVEGGRVVSKHRAVVGKVDRKTPILSSRIHQINFNPYWHVPKSIVKKDLVPRARRELKAGRRDLLKRFKIEAFDGRGRKVPESKIKWNSKAALHYSYRQLPWESNSMGFVKINFHNPHAVFMHDTPSKRIFGRNVRAASSGCIRVQNVKKLVKWILKDTKGWPNSRITKLQTSGERIDANVKAPVKLYFVYLSAWGDGKGRAQFRRDLYSYDTGGHVASIR